MNMEPRVSVIIPTRNRASLLKRALDSVLIQTYPHYEIIVVDDASEDDTPQVIRQYQKQNPKIQYFRNEISVGGAEARNIGMKQAGGEILAFLDDDDEWLPEKLEIQLAIFDIEPDVGIVGTGYVYIDVDRGTTEKRRFPESQSLLTLFVENTLGSFSFVCIRRTLFEKYGGIRADMESAQDWSYWIKLAPHTRISMVNDYLVRYYENFRDPHRISNSMENAVLALKKILDENGSQMSPLMRLKHRLWIWPRRIIMEDKVKNRYIRGIITRLFTYAYDFIKKRLQSKYYEQTFRE